MFDLTVGNYLLNLIVIKIIAHKNSSYNSAHAMQMAHISALITMQTLVNTALLDIGDWFNADRVLLNIICYLYDHA